MYYVTGKPQTRVVLNGLRGTFSVITRETSYLLRAVLATGGGGGGGA